MSRRNTLSGKPSYKLDESSVHWAPDLHPGYEFCLVRSMTLRNPVLLVLNGKHTGCEASAQHLQSLETFVT